MPKIAIAIICLLVCLASSAHAAGQAAAHAELLGTDFKGGAADLFGSLRDGEAGANYVYAQPNGDRSIMRAIFTLGRIPAEPLFLHVKARDDDSQSHTHIAIELNGTALLNGPNGFDYRKWEIRKLPIPAGLLKEGENTLVFSNLEPSGPVGNVPWFMLARCIVAPETYVIVRDIRRDFWLDLPKEMREFPEPLPAGRKPGFAMRGTKGWMWTPEQYLAEIPVLAKYKMNFLMNCYTSMCDVEHYRWGDPEVNRWWEDLPDAKRKAYESVVRACRKQGIQFCFSMNPGLCSKRPLNYNSEKDINDLWKHYTWMQGLGVEWFNISLDDISTGIDASGQARVVNEIYRRLKKKDPEVKFIFCPSIYWGDGTPAHEKPYLEILANEMDKDVYLFWTGDGVIGNITRRAAESYKSITKHRLFLWDNYPVNDAHATMHLGPVVNRDADLCEVVDGYMSNPMCSQNEANRIPLLTCADYAYNPSAYDPLRSIQQAILHLESSNEARQVLRELVERYPGFVIFGLNRGTGFNPVREQFTKVMALRHSRYIAEAMIKDLEDLAKRMDRAFPNRYKAEKKTVRDDIASLSKTFERYKD